MSTARSTSPNTKVCTYDNLHDYTYFIDASPDKLIEAAFAMLQRMNNVKPPWVGFTGHHRP